LTATALPERQPYPALYHALAGLLAAVCQAPSARGWIGALVGFEALVLRELGYGGEKPQGDFSEMLQTMDRLAGPLEQYLLADRRGNVMAARARLRELLGRI
jgi:DNA repair protein RecO (recombination protein O)